MTTLYQTIDSHIVKLKQNLNTSLVAKVNKVNYSGESIESINLQPVIDKIYTDGLRIKLPEIKRVPILFPSGGGGILSFPISEGDDVIIIVCQNDIDSYLSGDTSGKPNTLRKFSLTDAIAIPCIYPLGNDLKPSQDDVELKFNDNRITLKKDGSVQVETGSTFSVTNQQEELISLLSEVIETLENTTVNTIYGASPLNSKPQLASLKQRLGTFKE